MRVTTMVYFGALDDANRVSSRVELSCRDGRWCGEEWSANGHSVVVGGNEQMAVIRS